MERILEAGRLSPSAQNKQPWHFVVVSDKPMLRAVGAAMPRNAPYIAEAARAIVVIIEPTRFAESDASRAIQNMLLTAWAEGIGSNWTGFGGMDEIKQLLGIPAELNILAVLPFGYPAEEIGLGIKRRKGLSEIAHRDRWGNPYLSTTSDSIR
jgi:nitroreductase